MKIELWYIGKTRLDYIQQGIDHYVKQLMRYCQLEVKQLKSASGITNSDIRAYKKSEAEYTIRNLKSTDYLVLLDEGGVIYSSTEMSSWLQSTIDRSMPRIVFLIGGAYGFDESIYERAQFKLSLSKMTFPHQLVRVIFLEQLYRAFTILNNQNYHH